MSNNPPEILIPFSLADAETLVEDCEAAIAQLLTLIDGEHDQSRRAYIQKLADLLDHKSRVLKATRKAIKENV